MPPVAVSATIAVWATKPRVSCVVRHVKGRDVGFTEVAGQERLAALALRLHAEATQPS